MRIYSTRVPVSLDARCEGMDGGFSQCCAAVSKRVTGWSARTDRRAERRAGSQGRGQSLDLPHHASTRKKKNARRIARLLAILQS